MFGQLIRLSLASSLANPLGQRLCGVTSCLRSPRPKGFAGAVCPFNPGCMPLNSIAGKLDKELVEGTPKRDAT